MLQAFCEEVLEEFQVDALRDAVTDQIRTRFASYFA
jgi:hypothetical protein